MNAHAQAQHRKFTNTHAHLFIIDGLGHATWSSTMPVFLDPERRLFSEIATLVFERLLR